MFVVIFGTRGITSTKDQGQFNCPHCGNGSSFQHKFVRRYFTLYFVPVIPLDALANYIECSQCHGTYNETVLRLKPEETVSQFPANYMIAMKQVMIAVLLADGSIGEEEVKELQGIFKQLSGVEVSQGELRAEIASIQSEGSTAVQMMAKIAPQLNDQGKEQVIKAAYRIAIADGAIDNAESDLLSDVGAALEMDPAHLRGIIAELVE